MTCFSLKSIETMDYSRPHSIEVSETDVGYHFGMLLDTHCRCYFSVAGEKFHAHKLGLHDFAII
jgi:speckle-type POZ protein